MWPFLLALEVYLPTILHKSSLRYRNSLRSLTSFVFPCTVINKRPFMSPPSLISVMNSIFLLLFHRIWLLDWTQKIMSWGLGGKPESSSDAGSLWAQGGWPQRGAAQQWHWPLTVRGTQLLPQSLFLSD